MCTPINPPKHQGFALVVSLVLMAFLMLLMVGLSTLVSLQTNLSASKRSQESARMNALLGMQIALGELQRYAGSDQRVTGPSFILDDTQVDVQETDLAQPYWTQVWSTVPGEEAWSVALASSEDRDAEIGPESGKAVTLLGRGSLGDMVEQDDKRIVQAERMEIDGPQGVRGAYAWWVGDEGSKASLRADMPVSTKPWLHPNRFGLEMADSSLEVLNEEGGLAGIPYADRLITREQAKVIPGNPGPALEMGFHDYTVQANMLLTDVVHGGFRRNLTAALSAAGTGNEQEFNKLLNDPANVGGLQMFPPQLTGVATAVPVGNDPGGPSWRQLASWFQNRIADTGDASVMVRRQTTEEAGIYPVMQMTQIYYYVGLVPDPADSDYGYIRFMVMPVITLWNPYNARLLLDGGRADFMTSTNGNSPVFHARWADGSRYFDPGSTTAHTDVEYRGRNSTHWRAFMKITFRLPDGLVFEPGETKMFSVDAHTPFNNNQNYLAEGLHLGYGLYRDWTSDWTNEEDRIPITPETQVAFSFSRQPQDAIWSLWSDGHAQHSPGNPPGSLLQEIMCRYTIMAGVASTTFGNGGRVWETNADGSFVYRWSEHYSPEVISGNGPLSQSFPALGFKTAFRLPETSVIPIHTSTGINATIWGETPWLVNFNPRAAQHWGVAQANHPKDNPAWQNVSAPTIMLSNQADVQTHYFMVHDHADGGAYTGYSDTQGVNRMVLYDLPRSEVPIFSLGEFAHAPLSVPLTEPWIPFRSTSDIGGIRGWQTRALSWSPTYAVGNSWADMRIPPDEVHYQWNTTADSNGSRVSYDKSWLLNSTLWDRYFLTGREASDSSFGRVRPWDDALIDDPGLDTYDEAASLLRQSGGFNVNSTSVKAWEAFLASTWNTEVPGTGGGGELAPLLRYSYPRGGDPGPGGGSPMSEESNLGFRRLNETELRDLAEAVVRQVKQRGPFRSVADFVNRSRETSDADNYTLGALQAAINDTDINANLSTPAVEPSMLNSVIEGQMGNPAAFSGSVLAGIPGFLTQADLLSRLGSAINVRSDTFVIRSYGENINPVTQEVESKVWLEAVVQRLPELINDENSELEEEAAMAFGRRFRVISQRWLNENEI